MHLTIRWVTEIHGTDRIIVGKKCVLRIKVVAPRDFL